MPSAQAQRHEGISSATVFHAACALALSHRFRQIEVVFGRLVTGRSMLPHSLQTVVGPCLTEIPIRVKINPNATVTDTALQLHQQFIEDSTHESLGMGEIVRKCTGWADDVQDFGWRTAFQQEEESKFMF